MTVRMRTRRCASSEDGEDRFSRVKQARLTSSGITGISISGKLDRFASPFDASKSSPRELRTSARIGRHSTEE
jgi:hypothetical protein